MPKGQTRRKTFRNYDGFLIRENVCSDYTCRFNRADGSCELMVPEIPAGQESTQRTR